MCLGQKWKAQNSRLKITLKWSVSKRGNLENGTIFPNRIMQKSKNQKNQNKLKIENMAKPLKCQN